MGGSSTIEAPCTRDTTCTRGQAQVASFTPLHQIRFTFKLRRLPELTDAGKKNPDPPACVREQQQGHKAYYTMRGSPATPPQSSHMHGWQEYIGDRRGGFSSIALGFPPTCTPTWDPLRNSLRSATKWTTANNTRPTSPPQKERRRTSRTWSATRTRYPFPGSDQPGLVWQGILHA